MLILWIQFFGNPEHALLCRRILKLKYYFECYAKKELLTSLSCQVSYFYLAKVKTKVVFKALY